MPRVTAVQVIYNSKRFIEPVFEAIFKQTYKDFNVVAVISGNDDGGKELLMQKFPQVEIIDPGYNIGFAAGHNLVFHKYGNPSPSEERGRGEVADFFQLVNPDLIMEPDYIANLLKAFDDPKVGGATGKLLRYDFDNHRKTNIIDSTGVTIQKSGRARDRGQHETDNGQYDRLNNVDAVSGAGAMYRRSSLESVKEPLPASPLEKGEGPVSTPSFQKRGQGEFEYFDEDFHSYWEDVDLSWRMKNKGWKNVFVPSAVGYHGRGASSSPGGYQDIVGFVEHHRKLSPRVRQLNYKNHIFMYIKNSPWFYPQFFVREFFMLIYILLFETSTLKVLPEMFKLLPKMFKKRKYINRMASF